MRYCKMYVYVTALVTAVTLCSCSTSKTTEAELGDSDTSQETTTTTPTTTLTEVVTTARELTTQEKLQNTSWAGTDGNGNIMCVEFTDDTVTITSNGYRTDVSGYWDVDDERFTVYSDEALTQQIDYYDYTLAELGDGSSLLYVESLYLSKMDTTVAFDTLCDDFNAQFETLDTATDGSYWVGANSKYADFFVCNYGDIYLYVAQFGVDGTTYYDGTWGLTYGNGLYIVDSASGDYTLFNWRMDEDSYRLYLTPTDGTTTDPLEFVQTDATSFGGAIAIVNSHLDGSYVEVTTTEETTTEETTEETTTVEEDDSVYTDSFDNSIAQSNENMYYNNPEDVDSNPDDEDYDDYEEYFDNYSKAPENLYPQYYYTTTTQAQYDYGYSYDYDYGYDDSDSYGYGADGYSYGY